MTRRQSRIVAVQAAVVGVLTVIVFVTLLQPEGGGPLFGVRQPGERPGTLEPGPGAYVPRGGQGGAGERRGGGGGGGSAASGEASGGAAGGGAIAGAAVGTAPATALSPATAQRPGGEHRAPTSPADDQYDDTLTRLESLLR